MEVEVKSQVEVAMDGLKGIGGPNDSEYLRFRAGQGSSRELYKGWKGRVSFSAWSSLWHDLGFALWALVQSIRVLCRGRIPEDMKLLPKDLGKADEVLG